MQFLTTVADSLSHRAGGAPRAGWRDWLSTALVVGFCTLVTDQLDPYLDLADQVMLYLGGVVYIALRHGLAPSVVSVLVGVLAFDLVFVPPRWDFTPVNEHHLLTFAVMLLVGLLISRLAAQARSQTLLAEARAQRAQALYELSARLAVARSAGEVSEGVADAVRATFGAACEVRAPEDPPAASAVLCLPLQGTGAPLGELRVYHAPEHSHTADDVNLLKAFAHQTALALERCAFEQRGADAMVEAEAERLRSTLLSGISHDFRTPLTAIVGSATSLLQHEAMLQPSQRVMLARGILGEATRMHELVSNLLDLTRMEEGAMQLAPEWCPADELVESALQAVGSRASGHVLRTRVPADAIVWCDPRLVEQALVNLLDNALRHTPPGTVVDIVVDVPAAAREGAAWCLIVSDNGPGLPAGSERDVFLKFNRGHAAPDSGTGLGLAICAAVASLHGGTIAASERPGARFTLTLPQPAGGRAPADDLGQANSEQAIHEQPGQPPARQEAAA